MKRAASLALALFIGLIPLAPSAATTLVTVPGDYDSIQDAVDAIIIALPPDATILVAGGDYTGSVTISGGPPITIQAASPEETVVHGTADSVFRAENSANVILRDFILRDAIASGAGAVYGATLTVENCTIEQNGRAGFGAAQDGHLIIRNCLMRNNPPGGTTLSHGGVRLDNSGTTLLIEDSTIITDQVGTLGFGIGCNSTSRATVRNCVIDNAYLGITSNNSGTAVTVTGTTFSNCVRAISETGGSVDAGNLSNADTADDGRNLFLPNNTDFFYGNHIIAEGNVFPRIDPTYLSAKIPSGVDVTPALQLVIDRVSPNPDPTLFSDTVSGEWIELRLASNAPTEQTFDIGGWQLSDDPLFDGGDEGLFTIPASTELVAGESVLIARDIEALSGPYSLVPDAVSFELTEEPRIYLDPAGDELFLRVFETQLMDAMVYGVADDIPEVADWLGQRVAAPPAGDTLMREYDSIDRNISPDWKVSDLEGRLVFTPREAVSLR